MLKNDTIKMIGQAYDKKEEYLYTWWKNGTVSRRYLPVNKGYYVMGYHEEIIIPTPQHNLTDFNIFVPVEDVNEDENKWIFPQANKY